MPSTPGSPFSPGRPGGPCKPPSPGTKHTRKCQAPAELYFVLIGLQFKSLLDYRHMLKSLVSSSMVNLTLC